MIDLLLILADILLPVVVKSAPASMPPPREPVPIEERVEPETAPIEDIQGAVSVPELAPSATVSVLFKNGTHQMFQAVRVATAGRFLVLARADKPAAILGLDTIERMEVTPDARHSPGT